MNTYTLVMHKQYHNGHAASVGMLFIVSCLLLRDNNDSSWNQRVCCFQEPQQAALHTMNSLHANGKHCQCCPCVHANPMYRYMLLCICHYCKGSRPTLPAHHTTVVLHRSYPAAMHGRPYRYTYIPSRPPLVWGYYHLLACV